MISKHMLRGAFAAALMTAAMSAAHAGGYFTPNLPQVPSLNGTEQVPLDTEYPNGISPQTAWATSAQLAAYSRSVAGSNSVLNGLIGGDFGENLWQRGTTGPSTTTVLLYGPDRWWGISGTSTAFTIIKETAAADVTGTYSASARVQRTASQTGILPICVGQALTTANSYRFLGQKSEFVFWAKSGANFSPASATLSATIGYSVGGAADQTAANFQLAAWTAQANVTSAIPITTTWTRYSVVASVPVGITQIGVQLCYTPVGTAGANDWFEFTGAQLDVNPSAVALTGAANTTGQAGNAAAFQHRDAATEANLQYAYFWRLAEPASGAAIDGMCQAVGASTNICNVNMPVVMRATTPTIAITTAGTFKANIAGTPTTVASPVASTCSSKACAVTAGNTNTAGQAELLTGGGGTGAWDVSAEL